MTGGKGSVRATKAAWSMLGSSNHRTGGHIMPKYVIERELPGAGKLTEEELRSISQKSCGVLADLGPTIQWQHSYVTADKLYCVYVAPSEELVREHASRGGFPADVVAMVATTIDPTTAEASPAAGSRA
jgi:hypothetical protein